MATANLKLSFLTSEDWPGIAQAKVVLGDHNIDQSGDRVVGWTAAGPEELDGIIDMLIGELEQIRKFGRRKFANRRMGRLTRRAPEEQG